MLCIFRIGASNAAGSRNGLHKVLSIANGATKQQIAFISARDIRKDRPPRPPPFPYKEKSYNLYHRLFDNTLKRFDDNSVVIVVDGPIAVGKDKFARKFAEAFDMKYFPPVTFDTLYKNPYGFDMRDFDEQRPASLRTMDLKKFLAEPNHINTAVFQHYYYGLKYDQYGDALIHLLSTGEGVVVQRPPWSDFVFMEAMVKAGYVSREAHDYYKDMTLRTLHKILKPHVVIYLHMDVKNVLEKIKKRNNPDEMKSKVLTEKYLTDIENNYKQKYLKDMETYCHVLQYDWTDGGDFEYVIEDIERLTFNYGHSEKKMEDWTVNDAEYWRERRAFYSPDNRWEMIEELIMPRMDVPEMVTTGDEEEMDDVFKSETPGLRYALGYDPDVDTNLLWKTKHYTEEDLIHERHQQGTQNK